MSLTETLNNALSALTEGGLNRYRLDIPSCTASLDVEAFSGEECMSGLYQYTVLFTSSDLNISTSQLLSKPATLTMGTGPLMTLTGRISPTPCTTPATQTPSPKPTTRGM